MSFINTVKIIFVYSFIALLLISCDKQDDRMNFYNNTNRVINVELLNLKDTVTHSILPLRAVKPNSKKQFVKLFSLESDFDDIKPDTLIHVIVYKNFNKNIGKTTDSLLILGEYYYKGYSYKDLQKRNWEIEYPDDGFMKGFPVKVFRE